MTDLEFMRLALDLAELGEGDVSPNPLVGAVVERDGQVIGRGYHRHFGGPHAEAFALDDAGDGARGATLYVTLEPCCHYGKTPPCTTRIIASGIARVVVATRDPNPLVAGKGIQLLKAAGIEVDEGILKDEALRQNEIFFKYISTGLPFVHIKMATSLDGRIATRTGDSKWITGMEARTAGHRLRRRHAAIAVGIRTVIVDDPLLSVRHVFGRNPVPVVLDPDGRLPLDARLISDRAPIVVTATVAPPRRDALEARGCRVWVLPSATGRIDLAALLRRLGAERLDSLLVEGGGETAAGFLAANLVDRASFFIAPKIIGGRGAVPAIGGEGVAGVLDAWRLRNTTASWIGDDLLVSGIVDRPTAAAPARIFETEEGA